MEDLAMLINKQTEKMHISKYRFSKESGVSQATINDICNGNVELGKCAVGTLYCLAKVPDITIEDILDPLNFI